MSFYMENLVELLSRTTLYYGKTTLKEQHPTIYTELQEARAINGTGRTSGHSTQYPREDDFRGAPCQCGHKSPDEATPIPTSLRDTRVTAKHRKCQSTMRSYVYLGHVV